MVKRHFSDLKDQRLVVRGNKILEDLFRKGCHSIRQFCIDEASAKGCYRFLGNSRVGEREIISNLQNNCLSAAGGKYVVCIQDTTEINLISHLGRLNLDEQSLGTTNSVGNRGLGFFLHPSLVLDANDGIPYGYSDIKLWNRSVEFTTDKHQRSYRKLPTEQKESNKWLEVSQGTKDTLADVVKGIIIVQDREGDIYEQFARIPDAQTSLLVRARANRTLATGDKLFNALANQPSQGTFTIEVQSKNKRRGRKATIEIRYKEVLLKHTKTSSAECPPTLSLYLVEALECNYNGSDAICWRLLTTLPVEDLQMARNCIEWYSWRWTIEEIFKILKKEGYDIEASELESGQAIRKLCLMILEVIIKLFLMRLAYQEPETPLNPDSCFNQEELEFLEHQIKHLEGKTKKQKNSFASKDLKRYVWVIARLGGWKGYESKRIPGITTLWNGIQFFHAAMQGWTIHRNVSTR